jgi:short-subunit dehydrogenase
MNGGFEGKTVLITGGSSGIGRALAHAFSRRGARLILTARSSEALQRVVDEVKPGEAVAIPADLRNPVDIERLCAEARGFSSQIHVLVNNAGVGLYAPSFAASPERVRALFDLNFFAPLELVRRLLPAIPAGGSIVNISSIAGKVPLPWLSLYSASKFALNAFSDTLRLELAGSGVRVLLVCPGYVDTPFREHVLQGEIPEKVAGQRWFLISAEHCAEAVIAGLHSGKRTVVTPRIGWALVALARLLPGVLYPRLARMRSSEMQAAVLRHRESRT